MNSGFYDAYLQGIKASNYEYVFTNDASLGHGDGTLATFFS